MRKVSLSASDWRMELNIDDCVREERNMKDSPKTFVAMNFNGFLISLSIWSICASPFTLTSVSLDRVFDIPATQPASACLAVRLSALPRVFRDSSCRQIMHYN